jgi:hypothetical protein
MAGICFSECEKATQAKRCLGGLVSTKFYLAHRAANDCASFAQKKRKTGKGALSGS